MRRWWRRWMGWGSNSAEGPRMMENDLSGKYRRKWTEEERGLLLEWYGKIPVKEIARRLGRTFYGVIEQARGRRLGLTSAGKTRFMAETRVKYHYNRRFFAEMTEESAYWAGFLAADGCSHPARNMVQVILKAVDRGHLEKFAKAL